jgi:signal transduction histidine kinase/CheY-like chemotaxis protein
MNELPILTLDLRFEHDMVAARQRARTIAGELGFEPQDQTRIATAVSEIGRNALRYAMSGKIFFSIEQENTLQRLRIIVKDTGRGIENLQQVLAGKYRSTTGMGMGILGTRRLMDDFSIETSIDGTTVSFAKTLPKRVQTIEMRHLDKITAKLLAERPHDPLAEVQRQNQELMRALDELRRKQDELEHLNRELEDTNRGVVALYAELDEKADHLRRADELKSKFLSNMSHEFRTPLNSILALSRILLDRTDGDLSSEQEKQVSFIRKAASDLAELVNDLLDLAKVEAGKIVIQPVSFRAQELFGALRGMLRPLLVTESVALVFDDVSDLPELYTDEGKVSQILRNLISNALKFTERGEVRVSGSYDNATQEMVFTVADTGIGIPPEHSDTIFQEFTQVDSPAQRRVKGTGLGLPLSRRLAELLGGTLTVESSPGTGSTFIARIPKYFENSAPPEVQLEQLGHLPTEGIPVVVVEDRVEDVLVYEKYLEGTDFVVKPAYSIREAKTLIARVKPRIVILDILLKGEEGWDLLRELKSQGDLSPHVFVLTAVEDKGKALALGADAYLSKSFDKELLLSELDRLASIGDRKTAIVIDDEEISRYIVGQLLEDLQFAVTHAASGSEGLKLVTQLSPHLVILDLVMPKMTGHDVVRQLKSQHSTAHIPVIIYTSKILDDHERAELEQYADGILHKDVATKENALITLRDEIERIEQITLTR